MSQKRVFVLVLVLALLNLLGCSGKSADDPGKNDPGKTGGTKTGLTGTSDTPSKARFELSSPGVAHRGAVNVAHTCDGAGTTPELRWKDVPDGTKSLVLIVTDPDAAGNLTHWFLYNIPPGIGSLRAGLPADTPLSELGGAKQGRNDFGKNGWAAPCPPPGGSHRYMFKMYAIDIDLDVPDDADRVAVEEALKGHFRGQAAIIASYARKH